jgi:hypothetical protein
MNATERGPRRPRAGIGWLVFGALGVLFLVPSAVAQFWVGVLIGLLVLVVGSFRAYGSFSGAHRFGKAITRGV